MNAGRIDEGDLFSALLVPEATEAVASPLGRPWKVLLVDDEEDVHNVLHLALQDVVIEGCPLQLLDALSAREAKLLIAEHPDIVLILLDVVMESDQAGLELVRYVRDELANRRVQIVLITGQPGYAPQREVISGYAIDGYRLKSELNANQIVVQVFSAVRTYRLTREQELLQQRLRQKVLELDDALRALRESEANLVQAQAVAHVGSWTYHLASDEMRLSAEASRILGLPPGSVRPWHAYLECVCPDDRSSLQAAWQSLLDHGGPFEHEHKIRVGKALRHLRQRADLIRDRDGRPDRCVGTTQDITERKQAEEELKRSNADLEQFSYAISHDLRQPLRMIASYLQLLGIRLAGRLDSEQREFFQFAIEGAKRLDRMLVALLEYSRVGRIGEPAKWLESRAILEEALLFLQPAIAEAEAAIHVRGKWPRVFVSPDEILRLLQNLIGNAAKFRRAGQSPEIVVESSVSAGDWCLCVADNGVGIPPEQIGRLFHVFQHLQSRAAFDGSGVGLALCRKIAEHHGGRIWAESAGESCGSRFVVVLPLRREAS